IERIDGDFGLQLRWRGDRDRIEVRLIDHRLPVSKRRRDVGLPGNFRGARLIASGKRDHLASRIRTKRRELHRSSVVAANDSKADQGDILLPVRKIPAIWSAMPDGSRTLI